MSSGSRRRNRVVNPSVPQGRCISHGRQQIADFDAYIICGTPRSGSTLLCRLLASTGIAGNPDSFFRRPSIDWWANHWDVGARTTLSPVEFSRAYLAAALREGENRTGMFGIRIMQENVIDARGLIDAVHPGLPDDAARFAQVFGRVLYVHLSRHDKVAQAVSRVKAEQTGLWHKAPDGTELERTAPPQRPVYDFAQIDTRVKELTQYDLAWSAWFKANHVAPMPVIYEALADDPEGVLAGILDKLGLDAGRAHSAVPEVSKLADNLSREWAARYRADSAELGQSQPRS